MKLTPTFGRIQEAHTTDSSVSAFKTGLKVGDLIKGRVVRVLDQNRSIVNFKGYRLITEMDSPLTRGQGVQARVVSLDEQIRMRFMPLTHETSQFSDQVVTLLTEADLPVNLQTHNLAQMLQQNQIPVTAETFNSFRQYIGQLNPSPDSHQGTALAGWLLNLPPNSHLYQALQTIYGRRHKLTDSLQQLRSTLANLTQNSVEDIDDNLVQQILNQAQPLDFSVSDLANHISKFVNEIGLRYERELLAASRNSELLQKILQQQTLKQSLLLFRIQISQSDQISADSTARILEAVNAVLTQIDVLELTMNKYLAGRNQVYFQIPYRASEKEISAEVLGYSPEEDVGLNPENMRLEMLVETENLGRLKFDLRILQRQMNCTILAEKQEYSNFISGEKIALLERMQALRYDLKDVALKVSDRSEFQIQVVPNISELTGNMGRVDVSA
ncbi:hypothetical protein CMK12_03515 [Candidatus Poribacteria bacterium]|jgi:hypothetical protein|nr:hypothetical protein [Candidatus Poribacteria bacterium]MDP6746653.1 hypothetical protein [Candidatus Poribacteria bacterium]